MTDLKDLLELALPADRGLDANQDVDPAGDLARGRKLLRRRRTAGLTGAGVAAAGVAAVLVAVTSGGSPAGQPASRAQAAPAHSLPAAPPAKPSPTGHRSIALVSYEGRQIPGYQVASVPRGWVVQGGNAFALVIAPRGDSDQNIDSFLGKIVVMLKSVDEAVPASAPAQPVAGRPGYLRDQGITFTLTYQAADGRWVDIQVPSSLGWSGHRLAKFAAGVQVLVNAQESRG